MVDVTGHIAFGLLFAVGAWFLWDDRASVAFVCLAAVASLLPDVDLWLTKLFPAEIHHHGVTHTVLFAGVASVVGGALVVGLFGRRFDDWIPSERFDQASLFVFVTAGLLAGSLSHLVADMLSAPDIAKPINPFWPFFDKPWAVDVVWYNAAWINVGFFVVMVVIHALLAYATTPADHRYRLLRG